MTETFTGAEGRSVVASDTAEDIGEVKGFVVDPSATRVDAVHVSGRGRKAQVVAWSAISSFGADAVMADSSSTPEQVSTERETQAVQGQGRGTREPGPHDHRVRRRHRGRRRVRHGLRRADVRTHRHGHIRR